ncbi:MAG: hypothetical protein FWG58_01735 [Methanomassiliicoccaceae archaeon]|nr:hypothetical protein [Methanomassiliicoccaceae archaeon]
MANDPERPGLLHSFLGGLIFTILLVVVVPMLIAYFIGPIVNDALEDVTLGPLTPSTLITAVSLLILILFLLLLGGGKIFKKYGLLGIVGLIVAYWLLGNIWDAVLPIVIIILFVGIGVIRGK